MKSIGSGLKAHLSGQVITLCTCFWVKRKDGTIEGFTEHDTDLVIDGVTYRASTGYSAASLASRNDLSVDNTEIDALIDDINPADIAAGLYDGAEVRLFLVNWQDPSAGQIKLRRGWLGKITTKNGMFVAELRGLTQALQQTIGENYSATCRANLGDSRCKVNLTSFTATGTVTATAGDQQGFTDTSRTEAAHYFRYGLLTWTGGQNSGYSMEVKDSSGAGDITLAQAMPHPIAVGDTYSVYAGCDKLLATCISKFNNVVHFRGEPYVPGADAITQFGTGG